MKTLHLILIAATILSSFVGCDNEQAQVLLTKIDPDDETPVTPPLEDNEILIIVGGDDEQAQQILVTIVELSAAFESALPPSGSELAINGSITIEFTADPGEVTVNMGRVSGTGNTRLIKPPPIGFPVGALSLELTWTNGGDTGHTLHYTAIALDETPPSITQSTPQNGGEDVDPVQVFEDGISVTFDEPIIGNLRLMVGSNDVGWLTYIDGNKATLVPNAGQELSYETEYKVVGTVSDAAGNRSEVRIAFVTTSPPDPPGIENLVVYWPFEDGSGQWVSDYSGNGHDGKITGTPVWVDGKFVDALEFDGALEFDRKNDAVVANLASANIAENVTLMAWFKLDDVAIVLPNLFKSGDFFVGFDWIHALVVHPNDIRVWDITLSEWTHFALTFDGQSMKVYINGDLVSESANAVPITPFDADFIIGHRFFGSIDEVALYNKALNPTEIQIIMKHGSLWWY